MSGLVIWDFDGPIFNSRQARDIAFARVAEHFTPPSTHYKLFPLYSPRQTICLAYSDRNLGSDVLDEMEAYFRAELLKAEADIKVTVRCWKPSKICSMRIASRRYFRFDLKAV